MKASAPPTAIATRSRGKPLRRVPAQAASNPSPEVARGVSPAQIAHRPCDEGFPFGNELSSGNGLSGSHQSLPRGNIRLVADDDTTFSKNLERCMRNKGWKPADLARHMGVGNPTVSRWLNSRRKLSAQDLLALSAVLGVEPETLFGSSFEPPAPAPPKPRRGRPPKSD